jgi:phosphopantetheinyl transferase
MEIKDSRLKHITAHSNLKQVITLSHLPNRLLQSMTRTRGGKLTAGKYYINITYADSYAFMMVTKQKFGIDAERIKPRADHVKQLLSIMLSTTISSDVDFYKTWTAMESEVKYDGDKGLFDALMGNLKKNPSLQTIHLMYEDNMIAITSTENNLKAQEVVFKKCQDENV